MDIFRSIFGLPRREEQIPFTPRSELPSEGLFIVDEDEEVGENDEHEYGMPSHNLFGQMDQEIREMERHMKDMWSVFGRGSSLFTDEFRKLFDGFGEMPGMLHPGEESVPALPAPAIELPEQEAESLRKSMLKPSMVPPSPGQRKDEDLDSRVEKGGLSAILGEADDSVRSRKAVSPFQFKRFSRSVSVETIRRPDGTMETRKVERDSDGNEVVTITEHPADGSSPPGLFGHFGGHPGSYFSFSGHFGAPRQGRNWPSNPDKQDLSMFEKIFGKF